MNNPTNIGLIFDCDGTLLDSMGMWHGLDDTLAERAGVQLTEADRDYMTRATIDECSTYLHEHCGIGASAADVKRMIDEEILSFYSGDPKLKPGVRQFVEGMYELGVPMAVASSTPPEYLKIGLRQAGMAHMMRTILSVDDVGKSKRDPLIFDVARESLGTDRVNTWGFDDALYAIQTLAHAGYKTCAVYDSDIAGTPSQLSAAANIYYDSLAEVTPRQFLSRIGVVI